MSHTFSDFHIQFHFCKLSSFLLKAGRELKQKNTEKKVWCRNSEEAKIKFSNNVCSSDLFALWILMTPNVGERSK